jgi:hypothetical protein
MLGVNDCGFIIMLDVSTGTQAWQHTKLKCKRTLYVSAADRNRHIALH